MALNIFLILAINCDYKRIFSKLSNILVPQQSRMKPDVIAAL